MSNCLPLLQDAYHTKARVLLPLSRSSQELRHVIRVLVRSRERRLPVRLLLPVFLHPAAELPRQPRKKEHGLFPTGTTLSQRCKCRLRLFLTGTTLSQRCKCRLCLFPTGTTLSQHCKCRLRLFPTGTTLSQRCQCRLRHSTELLCLCIASLDYVTRLELLCLSVASVVTSLDGTTLSQHCKCILRLFPTGTTLPQRCKCRLRHSTGTTLSQHGKGRLRLFPTGTTLSQHCKCRLRLFPTGTTLSQPKNVSVDYIYFQLELLCLSVASVDYVT